MRTRVAQASWKKSLRKGLLPLVLAGFGTAALAADHAAAPARLTLEQAVAQGLELQPNIAGARASRRAAITQHETATSPLAIIGGPQIHVRRRQAELGVAIAQSGLEQVELETVNAVTRAYISVVYATEQLRIAEEAQSQFKSIYETGSKLLEAGSDQVTKSDIDRIRTYQLIAETRVSEARMGITRAKAALREAMGLPQSAAIEVADEKLSKFYDDYRFTLECSCAVEVALRCRPEVIQAKLAAEVACLEVDAQGLTAHTYARTYAATADIHAKVLPANLIDGDYRPGAMGPEMPVYLAGHRTSRQQRARDFAERAQAVSEKTRGLVALEVEEACIRMTEQGKQVEALRKAAEQSKRLAEEAIKAYRADQLKTEQMLTAQLVDATTRASLNEAVYKYAVALASLQRATGGQLGECLMRQAAPAPEPKKGEPKKDEKKTEPKKVVEPKKAVPIPLKK